MNDESVFGPVFHRLAFAEAIEKELLSDYRVVIVGIDDDRYRRYAEQARLLTLDGVKKTEARTLAAHIGLAKAMRTYDMQRVISFHGRVSGATQFARTLPDIIDWMPRRERPSGQVWAAAVSGAMSSGDRKTSLDRLRAVDAGERGILSNARCLGEGIDVPTLDGVAFIDPKHSQVDIVQAVGRAIRKGDGTRTATIVIPVFVDSAADGEGMLDSSAYRAIGSVLRALRNHDEELAEELDAFRRRLGQRSGGLPEKVILDLPLGIRKAFSTAIQTKVIKLTTASWEEWIGQLTAYAQAEGHARVPQTYRTEEGYRLGLWVENQRMKKDRLSADRRDRLEAVDGWLWDPFATDWETGFAQLTAYAQAEGHAGVPSSYRTATGYRLGQWASIQRSKQDSLSADRRQRLEGLKGWVWDLLAANWKEKFAQLTAYVQAQGHARVPRSYRTASGSRLGDWVATQRSKQDSLSADRRQRLEALEGWRWDPRGAAWEEGFRALIAYVQTEGHAQVSASYRTVEGYGLGTWVVAQRSKQDSLSTDRRQRLEALEGWRWDPRAAAWDEGFVQLTAYVQAEGHARVAQTYSTAKGYGLGAWVAKQRRTKNRLSADRRQRLEELEGWVWDAQDYDAAWDEGFVQLTAYVQAEEHARVPQTYRTPMGYGLAARGRRGSS